MLQRASIFIKGQIMALITILVCLAIVRFAKLHSSMSFQWLWGKGLVGLLQETFNITSHWIMITGLLLPPLFVVAIVYYGLYAVGGGYTLFAQFIAGICLWLSLGTYVLQRNDEKTIAAKDFFIEVNQRLFGLLIWFVVFGPCGCLLYRFVNDVTEASEQEDHLLNFCQDKLHQLHDILDWVPVRLSVLLYGLAGDFGGSFTIWSKHCMDGPSKNVTLLVIGAQTALGLPTDEDAQLDVEQITTSALLMERALGMLVVLVVIFTLGAWIF